MKKGLGQPGGLKLLEGMHVGELILLYLFFLASLLGGVSRERGGEATVVNKKNIYTHIHTYIYAYI